MTSAPTLPALPSGLTASTAFTRTFVADDPGARSLTRKDAVVATTAGTHVTHHDDGALVPGYARGLNWPAALLSKTVTVEWASRFGPRKLTQSFSSLKVGGLCELSNKAYAPTSAASISTRQSR